MADENGLPTDDSEASSASRKLERRDFFTEGFRNLLKPFSSMIESRLDHFNQVVEESRQAAAGRVGDFDHMPDPPRSRSDSEARLLRPPGALEEELFLERCATSGQCVSACPVEAIQVMESDDPRLDGTPFINPRVQACVVCEDLACMKVCPSGALQSVPRRLIHIGTAELRQDICLRTAGEDCQICVEKCPLGDEAIHIPESGDEVVVKDEGCVGCGVCEMYCPTEPRAIVINLL